MTFPVRSRRIPLALLSLATAATLSIRLDAETLFTESRPSMGTTFTIALYAAGSADAATLLDAAFEEIDRLDETFSNYKSTSELSRINRLAGHEAVVTDPEVFGMLEQSLEWSRRTRGAFDVTVGRLMRAWGFFRGQGSFPSAAQLTDAIRETGWQRLVLDRGARAVRFLEPNLEIDLGGIAKGYAVDRAVAVLREAGVKSALVDAGSSTVYALGAPPSAAGWRVLVPDPADRSRTLSTVVLRDHSLSSSGNYEKFFELGGRTYCHIMDPRTGRPVSGMLQTTVIAPSAIDSDALSTATFVLGPAPARTTLEGMTGAAALFVTDQQGSGRVQRWHWPGPEGDS